MSMFGDYKSYRKFAPQYPQWKTEKDLAEAKRLAYLKNNPSEIKTEDIQKSKTILRAIDIMDEYSQKRAEDMEVATQSIVSVGLEIAMFLGAGLGLLATQLKPVKNMLGKLLKNNNKLKNASPIIGMIAGAFVGTIAAFPLFAWAANAEVKASRKGRFEAMRNELNDTKTFATLTPEQEDLLQKNLLELSTLKEKKKPFKGFGESWQTVKDMVVDSSEYIYQKHLFEENLLEDEKHFDEKLSLEEIENAKKDQQLLTKLVEKIDIASQDYAENAELATATLITLATGFSGLFTLGYEKLANKFKWKQSALPAGTGLVAMLASSIFAAQIQKQAARVGRFKVKQELAKHPEQLVYVSDEKTGQITDVKINSQEKMSMFKFLKQAWKNNKEFEKWKKEVGSKEKNISKAMENIDLTENQLTDARRLQHNTFKTFNKIDEKSQKYAESIEALGESVQAPLSLIFTGIGLSFGIKYLEKAILSMNKKNIDKAFIANAYMKYISIVFLSSLPSILINTYVTKEQKKASRVANMLAINELQDYRNFADYSKFKTENVNIIK